MLDIIHHIATKIYFKRDYNEKTTDIKRFSLMLRQIKNNIARKKANQPTPDFEGIVTDEKKIKDQHLVEEIASMKNEGLLD